MPKRKSTENFTLEVMIFHIILQVQLLCGLRCLFFWFSLRVCMSEMTLQIFFTVCLPEMSFMCFLQVASDFLHGFACQRWFFRCVFFTVLQVWEGRRKLPRGSTIPQSTLRSSLLKITFSPQRRVYITEQTDQEAGGLFGDDNLHLYVVFASFFLWGVDQHFKYQ